MRRLIVLLLLLLIPGFALAQYPSPVFQNATVNGALNAIGGGILAGPYTGAPVLSGLWTFNGGLGTNAAAITGGSINGTPIGATTPATGAFTTIGASGAVTLSATGIALAITNSATIGGTLTINPSGANPLNITNALFSLTGSGSAGYTFSALTTGNMVFQINSQSVLTLRQATSGVNGIVITEGATGAGAQIQQGGDATGTLKLGAGAGGNTGTLQSLVPLLVQGPISFGLSQTLVSGSGFGAVGSVNPAPLWYNSILQGTINTGASSPFEFQVTDKMVMPNPLPIWAFTDNTAAGYDGARTPFSITLVKAAATASGGTFGSNTVLTVTQSVAVGDGGTQAAPNGVNTATNFVLRCYTGDWLSSCVQSEWDLALQAGTHALQKTSMGLHYSQFDGQHASGTTALPLRWTDATLQMTAATNIGNGTGKGIVMILLGDHSQDLPWDNTPGIGTALMAVQMNDSQNFPTATESGAQIDDGFRLVDVFARNNFINNGAFHVDGQGNVYSCLATVKATSTGSSIDVTGQTEVSATVTTPVTTGAVVGSSMTDSLGGIWQVTGVTGTFPNTNPTAVTLLRPACVGTPPANPITASMSGGGVSGGVPPVSLNVTWSGAQNTLTLQPSGGTVNLQGTVSEGGPFTFSGTYKTSPFGTFSDTTAVCIRGNATNCVPQITGLQRLTQLSQFLYTFYSSASLYIDNSSRLAPMAGASSTYDATHIYPSTPLSAGVVAQLNSQIAACARSGHVVCTLIYTTHTPNGYAGSITAVAADGSSITVGGGWYLTNQGVEAGPVTPPGTADAYINPDFHPYAQNIVTYLNAGDTAHMSTGLEIDVLNYQADSTGSGNVGNALGMTSNCHGPHVCSNAYIAQGAGTGPWYQGYLSLGNQAGFTSHLDSVNGFQILHDTTEPAFGFISYQASGVAFAVNPAGTGYAFESTAGSDGSNTVQFGNQGLINTIQIAARVGSTIPPQIQALGPQTNIDIRFIPKGTGVLRSDTAFRSSVTTVSGLGTCNSTAEGQRWAVSDATAATPGAALTGGGSTHVPAYCNGTNWIDG
jgi:hypothetical protein